MLFPSLTLLEALSLYIRSLLISLERLHGEAYGKEEVMKLFAQKSKNSINGENQCPIHMISVTLVQLTLTIGAMITDVPDMRVKLSGML